jgi:hypothetical protein
VLETGGSAVGGGELVFGGTWVALGIGSSPDGFVSTEMGLATAAGLMIGAEKVLTVWLRE